MKAQIKLKHYSNKNLCLRMLALEDLPYTLRWRNFPEHRIWFRNSNPISWNDHLNWFEIYLKKNDDFVFILEDDGKRVGQAAIYNICQLNKIAEVGRFVVAPKAANFGYMKKACQMIIKIADLFFKLKTLHLEVRKNNQVAMHIYERNGFKEYKTVDDFIYMMCSLKN
jgi:diamine N-acetyltransferase